MISAKISNKYELLITKPELFAVSLIKECSINYILVILRFFDLKRYGLEYTHVWSVDAVLFTLKWNDRRRAIEVPQEVLAAGMASSQEPVKVARTGSYERSTENIFKTEMTND